MYLVIFEDGGVKTMAEIGVHELSAADDGYLDIIDISDPELPTRYFDEGWTSIDDAGKPFVPE